MGYWWRSGIRVTRGIQPADFYGEPKQPFSPQEIQRMLDYWLGELNARTPYNIPKLLGMYLAVKLGWRVPFQARALGDICSPTVDKAIKRAPRDALPGSEQATTPGAFLRSDLFFWTAA